MIGGPGTGKSHLVAAYARSAPVAAWYRLTSADRDPLVFAGHLLAGLVLRLGFLSERPGQVLEARGEPALAAAFGLLCDELAAGLTEPLVLVVDECHHLAESRHLEEGLETLVQFFPEGSQLLLAGRTFDSLGLAGYELRDELVVVGDQELAFTREEVADLFAAIGKRPDPTAAAQVFEWARGWAIAVAHAARRAGDVPLREAERQAQARADSKASGLIWAALSTAATYLGEVDEQARYAELGLAALPEEAAETRAACLNSRGLAALGHRDFAAAEADFQAVQDLSWQAHRPLGVVYALHILGHAASLRGDHRRAIDLFRASIAQAQSAKVLPFPMTYSNLAVCYLWLGRAAESAAAIEEGTALAERLASPRDRAYLLAAAGLLYDRQGDLSKARSALAESLAVAEECGDRLARVQVHFALAEASIRIGELDEAQLQLAQGVGAAARSLDDPELLWAATLQADLHLRRDERERARILLARATRTLEQFPNPFQECFVLRLRAALCRMEGDREGEAAHRGRLRELAERFGYPLPGDWPSLLPVVDPQTVATIHVQCFGPFEARVGGRSVEPWGAAKAKAMLAYLVLHPAGVSRQDLVEALYPDQEVSRSTVHMALSRLREALEPECREGAPSRFVLFSGGRYRLNPGTAVWCDVAEFGRLLDHAAAASVSSASSASPGSRRALLEGAARLYTGAFLAEFQHIPWVHVEAERLRSRVIRAFEDLLAIAGAGDDWEALEGYADSALRVETCHHPSIRAKIVALAMQERLQEAVRFGGRSADRPCGCAVTDRQLHELLAMLETGSVSVRALRSFLPPLP